MKIEDILINKIKKTNPLIDNSSILKWLNTKSEAFFNLSPLEFINLDDDIEIDEKINTILQYINESQTGEIMGS